MASRSIAVTSLYYSIYRYKNLKKKKTKHILNLQ
jgi:hypothetical protein